MSSKVIKNAPWLYNEEFAHAWRGYMNPNPLICIRSPSTPWLLFGKEYLGNIAPLRAGKISISWDYAKPIGKKGPVPKRFTPNPQHLNQIKQVHIYQGDTILGSGPATGSISAGQAWHAFISRCHGTQRWSKHAGWPSGFVAGNMYREEVRKMAPKALETAVRKGDWVSVRRYAELVQTRLKRMSPNGPQPQIIWQQRCKRQMERLKNSSLDQMPKNFVKP